MACFLLASESPRRRQLMTLSGYPFVARAPQVDEASIKDPDPAQNCLATAKLKAEVAGTWPALEREGITHILAADTTVALELEMLGKPEGPEAARSMLKALRGRTHEVHTGMVVLDLHRGLELAGVHTAEVTMRDYSDVEIDRYVASGDPLDKAGAYAIQHDGFRPVAQLEGCYLAVMGLSICHLLLLLADLGMPLRASLPSLIDAHQDHACPLLAEIRRSAGK